MNSIPNATTVAFFRERMSKVGEIEEVFEMFDGYLRTQGHKARDGKIIDASLVPVLEEGKTHERTCI